VRTLAAPDHPDARFASYVRRHGVVDQSALHGVRSWSSGLFDAFRSGAHYLLLGYPLSSHH
jgi:hypothetical protein